MFLTTGSPLPAQEGAPASGSVLIGGVEFVPKAATVAPVAAPASTGGSTVPAVAQTPKSGDYNAFLSFGPSFLLTNFKVKEPRAKSYSETYTGGNISGGFKMTSAGIGSLTWGVDLGVYATSVEFEKTSQYTLDRVALPALLTCHYEFDQLLEGRIRLRAGLSLGATTFISSFSNDDNGKEKVGTTPTGGLSVGFTWGNREGFYTDLGWRLLSSGSVQIHGFSEKAKILNQVNLSIGYRF